MEGFDNLVKALPHQPMPVITAPRPCKTVDLAAAEISIRLSISALHCNQTVAQNVYDDLFQAAVRFRSPGIWWWVLWIWTSTFSMFEIITHQFNSAF